MYIYIYVTVWRKQSGPAEEGWNCAAQTSSMRWTRFWWGRQGQKNVQVPVLRRPWGCYCSSKSVQQMLLPCIGWHGKLFQKARRTQWPAVQPWCLLWDVQEASDTCATAVCVGWSNLWCQICIHRATNCIGGDEACNSPWSSTPNWHCSVVSSVSGVQSYAQRQRTVRG